MTVRASVIIVTYNHAADVQRSLEAVIPTLSARDDVIVVDNASCDGTPDIVAERYPRVRLIRSAENRGFGAGCNSGARAGHGEYLVFLNPDTEPRDGWLDALLNVLQSTPGAGLVTPKLQLAWQRESIDAFGHSMHVSGISTCRGWGEPLARYEHVEEVAAVSGACFAIERRVFDELKGFEERLFTYYEDDDLSLRARLAGYSCLAVPNAIVAHDHTPGFSPKKLRCLERNRLWTTLKLYSPSTLLAMLPLLLVAEILGWGLAFRYGPWHVLAKIQAWVDLLRWLPDLPPARRSVIHRIRDRDLLRLHQTRLAFSQVASSPLAKVAETLTAHGFSFGRKLASL